MTEQNIEQEIPEAKVVITFPNGPHTTNFTVQYVNVDPAQLEIAGHFLVRQAVDSYRTNLEQQQTSKIVPVHGRLPTS